MNAQERDERITGLAALSTVVLMLPAVIVAALYPVPTGGDPTELVAHLARHRVPILVALYLGALAWGGMLVVFAGGLWALLRRGEGEGGVWALVAFGACVATAAAILVALAIMDIVVYRAPGIDPAVASLLYHAANVANLMTAFPNAVYTLAAALVIRRTSVLPQAIAYGALLVAAIHLLSATSQARSGALAPWGVLPSIAPLSHTAWLAAIAFVLLRPGRRTRKALE